MSAGATALRKGAQAQCFWTNAAAQRRHSAVSTLLSSLTITPFFALFILTALHPHFSVLKSFSLDHLAKHSIFYCCDWKLKNPRRGEQKKKKKKSQRHKMSLEHLFMSYNKRLLNEWWECVKNPLNKPAWWVSKWPNLGQLENKWIIIHWIKQKCMNSKRWKKGRKEEKEKQEEKKKEELF